MSRNGKFHALFATSSIPEAIQYYKKFRSLKPELRISALFDPNDDNKGGWIYKEDALKEILEDYNKRYNQSFGFGSYDRYKKDIARRLAHKKPYIAIENTPENTIDILIVVDQMLTGFDSKWINTLYLDKVLKYENVVQAFSRTNRLFGPEKPHGIIRYYRKPHTMEQLIDVAFKLYSGDKPLGIYVDNLEKNLNNLNAIFDHIYEIFKSSKIENFERLPDELSSRAKFASLFKAFNNYLEAALIQGFTWKKLDYVFSGRYLLLNLDETTYLILALRYKELFIPGEGPNHEIPYEIQGYLTEINTSAIDADYMNSRFVKYIKELQSGSLSQEQSLIELHKTFATLSQEDQKYANIFLHDVQRGDIKVEANKTLREYITEYRTKAKDDQIHRFAQAIGADESLLRELLIKNVVNHNINEYGQFDKLKSTIKREIAKEYLEKRENASVPNRMIMILVDDLLRRFIQEGGFEI